jgi:hypothetical protein
MSSNILHVPGLTTNHEGSDAGSQSAANSPLAGPVAAPAEEKNPFLLALGERVRALAQPGAA